MTDAVDDKLYPFLTFRGAGGPALSGGVPSTLAEAAPRPRPEDTTIFLADLSGEPDDLRAQQWGVVIPDDERGHRLLSLVRPLLAHRGEQQGREPHVYRVQPNMTAEQAVAFVLGPYQDEVPDTAERPRYLLLLGDSDGVSWELQRVLAQSSTYPGRLAFDTDQGYEAYVEKLLAWESEREARAIASRAARYFAVRDSSEAVSKGLSGFLLPSHGALSKKLPAQVLAADLRPIGIESPKRLEDEASAMLADAARTPGGLLVSLSHGVALERSAPLAERRAHQGAMHVHARRALTAEDLRRAPFFEGGAWFFFACFSAGTPRESVYRPWLRSLAERRFTSDDVDVATRALPDEPSPFVAALPKAALASPRGPLAVFGHVDLAWTWSFAPVQLTTGERVFKKRHARFTSLFEALLARRRFGAAFSGLSSASATVGAGLLTMYGSDEKPPAGEKPEQAADRAHRWLEHHDLAGFVLLGDPAARLPATAAERRREDARPAEIAQGGPSEEVLRAERDVLKCLEPGEDVAAVADLTGRTAEQLAELVETYREAGRRALAEVLAAQKR